MGDNGFQEFLDHLRSLGCGGEDNGGSNARRGRLFERAMRDFFEIDPLYSERFLKVELWGDWAAGRKGFDGTDIGIDLVARERDGGFCAIQCKLFSPETRIQKRHIDSFVSASSRDPFTARLIVDTGAEWGPNARRTVEGLKPGCTVLDFAALSEANINWRDLLRKRPGRLKREGKAFDLRPHQEKALDEVVAGLDENDRGQMIMACGTGKTFTALRIAEKVAGKGGRALFLVPSISLLQQAMREWAEQKKIPHRYIGICSDTRAGKEDEDASLSELEIPVTTDPDALLKALRRRPRDAMLTVFCTYQSLPLVERAQKEGAPEFDLALCDEAHRTTGVDRRDDEDERTSPFVLVHDGERIRARKRLYMTATPRLYTEGAKAKAARHDVEVFSMDDPDTYGPEFHRLAFSKAVEMDLLSDYRVVIFALSEGAVDGVLSRHHLTEDGSEINLTDTAKIVACWRALQNPENRGPGEKTAPLKRAIAFTNKIVVSKRIKEHWDGVVEQAITQLPEKDQAEALRCETEHVDGQFHALDRKKRIEWLKGETEGACRILSNARCLSEGIDVPALDAVLFLGERRSVVDVVQAVGRVMRKAEGKEYGYIVLPVAVPAGTDPKEALDDNKNFAGVWSALRALRSHDDRLNAEINKLDLNQGGGTQIIIGVGDDGPGAAELPFPPLDVPPGAIYAKVVEKCGDRRYWESWAKDVAEIFTRLTSRIGNLLKAPANGALREWFAGFHKELRTSINDSVEESDAVEMMAQHIITRPVFEALFEGYDFAGSNPVARALDELTKDFKEFGLENETRDLKGFYESVQLRARGLDNAAARQRVLMELYEKFFATAMKKDAERLGIVYTPTEVVDFILASADHVLREEFGRGLTDKDVHVLDPFTGTGIFLVRLLQSALISDADLSRKYRKELHANELVLLAYYIAAIHVEEAYRGRKGGDYEPFDGVVLTDTFNLLQKRGLGQQWLPDNSRRVRRQQKQPIEVIVGNPPWSAGQRSSADDNPNVDYPEMEKRIAETYVAESTATLVNSLYDTYKMAIRWATDRIEERGIVAFVTNGSWIDGLADSGVRACLAREFDKIYVLNLRGNLRTRGDVARREGESVFKQGTRTPVAITILVRRHQNSAGGGGQASIFYRDIGDCLPRREKLSRVAEWGSTARIPSWEEISPDEHHDWVNQRDPTFQDLYPMGTKDAKAGKKDDAAFKLFSNGYITGRDAYLYNFSHDSCADNGRAAVADYADALKAIEAPQNLGRLKVRPDEVVNDIIKRHSVGLRWDMVVKNNLRRRKKVVYSGKNIWTVQYRPFVKQFCYVEYVLANGKYQQDRIFPEADTRNRAICVPGIGAKQPFSTLMTNAMPDRHFLEFGQCFPRYRYEYEGTSRKLMDDSRGKRIDNISSGTLSSFQQEYRDKAINKDEIFNYVYGILHAPTYRKRFINDLTKGLPRIPFAPYFWEFAKAGENLSLLHLSYESCKEYPLREVFTGNGKPTSKHYLLTGKKMKFSGDDRNTLQINEHINLTGIPTEAHDYQISGRTPLEWFIDRYRITTDKESGITNDPNGWFDDPRDIVAAIRRIVYVSVETARIIANLPEPFAD